MGVKSSPEGEEDIEDGEGEWEDMGSDNEDIEMS
jgi:hypothetical protein